MTFIDLFAGVGGFHLALTHASSTLECIFASEIDPKAQQTYRLNFPSTPLHGDITASETRAAVPHCIDIIVGGFPCQAFSVAGLRQGFQDTRGQLFFEIERIARERRPRALLLENVKHLITHDGGRTFATITSALTNLGYSVNTQVLSPSTHANIPQHRERVFIVALDTNQVPRYEEFQFPRPVPLTRTIHDCLNNAKQDDYFYYTQESPYYDLLNSTITRRDTVYQLRRTHVRENKSNLCPTLTANMGTGGHNVPLIRDDYGIRKLTPRECFNFQGYPHDFKLPNIAKFALYKQAGNSIAVPLVTRIAQQVLEVLR